MRVGAAIGRYCVVGFFAWLIGIQFLTGWKWDTLGVIDFPGSVVDGLLFLPPAAILVALVTLADIHPRGMSVGFALGVGFLVILGAFPLGCVIATIWNAIGGTYPDVSGLGNRMSLILVQ